jgi:hypothetical protein
MHNPKMLRGQARRCRTLMKTAMEPKVIEQLRLWAVELAEKADGVERAADSGLASDPRPGPMQPRCARGRRVRALLAPRIALLPEVASWLTF